MSKKNLSNLVNMTLTEDSRPQESVSQEKKEVEKRGEGEKKEEKAVALPEYNPKESNTKSNTIQGVADNSQDGYNEDFLNDYAALLRKYKNSEFTSFRLYNPVHSKLEMLSEVLEENMTLIGNSLIEAMIDSKLEEIKRLYKKKMLDKLNF